MSYIMKDLRMFFMIPITFSHFLLLEANEGFFRHQGSFF